MRPVRHRSRAFHQVRVCVVIAARHSQVRSPNMLTSHYIVAGMPLVRGVHIAPVSRGLHSQMKRVWTTCNPQRRSSIGDNHASNMLRRTVSSAPTSEGWIGSKPRHSEKTFFLFEMSRSGNKTTTNFLSQRARGRARLFFSFLFIFFLFIYLITLIQFIIH